jgi:ectoine hydroxylase-related dioxygenase (phytanoyl-CoA dioxygenase family)
VPAADAAAMADAVSAELARRHGVDRRDPTTWTASAAAGLGRLRKADAFAALGSPAVREAIAQVVGHRDPDDWGGPLVTFPQPGTWAVPHGGWHLDLPVRGAPGNGLVLKWLGYLEAVRPGAGGTVVIAGSHRLVASWDREAPATDPGRSPAVRDAVFGLDPWFCVLGGDDSGPARAATLSSGTRVHGVDVQVVELDGEPGDVVLLHPHLLHAAAPNHGSGARIMVTGGVYEAR